MKNLLVLFALTAVLTSTGPLSFAQQQVYFGAGSTIIGPMLEDAKLQNTLGYFVGLTREGQLEGPFRYSGSLQFVKQHMDILDASLNVNAINGSFYYGIETLKEVTILAGVQMGYIIDVEFDDTEVLDHSKEQLGWITGLSYDILEKVKIEARYVRAINEQIFDYTIQFGIHYKL